MSYSIIENSIRQNGINIFNTATSTNNLKYYAGDQVVDILVTNSKTHLISISKFDHTIIYYNLTTSAVERTITAITLPIGGLISNDDNYLYILRQNTKRLYRISLADPALPITYIPISIIPLYIITNSTNSTIYLCGNNSLISVVSTATFAETSTITLPNPTAPHIVADFKISPDNNTLVYLDQYYRTVLTVNLLTTTSYAYNLNSIATRFYQTSCIISPDNSTVYVLGHYILQAYLLKLNMTNGVLSYSNLQTTSPLNAGMVLSTDGSKIYLLNTILRQIQVRATSNFSLITTIALTKPPYYFYIDALTNTGYVLDKHSGLISKINLTSDTIISNSPSYKTISAAAVDNL